MTAEQIEYPAPPWVELYAPALTPEEVRVLTAVNSAADPRESWRNALMAHRVYVIEQMRKRLAAEALLTPGVIRSTLDTVWQLAFPLLHRATGPMVAEAYIHAFKAAGAGDIPIKMVYALAEEHVRRTGEYFHGTSSDALIQGFNTYVNRQVPAKAAMARVLDAYGLTPRQMSGLTSAKRFEGRVESSTPLALKSKIKSYIGKSISDRLGIFTRQESHNLNEQAQQIAWMWMVDHGKLPRTAEKMWLTAKDERVCAICGPLHRTKIPLGDRFILEDGQKLYVPGAHTNCRCTVRLQLNVTEIGKADRFDPREHPRGSRGRFIETPDRTADPELERMVAEAKALQEERQEEAIRQIEETPEAPRLVSRQLSAPKLKSKQPTLRTTPTLRTKQVPLQSKQVAAELQSKQTEELRSRQETTLTSLVKPKKLSLVLNNPQVLRSRVTEALQATSIPSRPKQVLRYSVKFADRDGDPRTVYTIVDNAGYGQAVDAYSDRAILQDNNELKMYHSSLNNGTIASEVLEAYRRNLEAKTAEILEAADADGIGWTDLDEQGNTVGAMMVPYPSPDPALNQYHTTLDHHDIMGMLEAYVNRRNPAYTDQTMDLEWEDDDGDPAVFPTNNARAAQGRTDLSEIYISDLMADPAFQDPKDDEFEVVVVTLDEGHEETLDSEIGAFHGEETYTAPGVYNIGWDHKHTPLSGMESIPIRHIHVAPEVTEEVIDPGQPQDLPHDKRGDWHP